MAERMGMPGVFSGIEKKVEVIPEDASGDKLINEAMSDIEEE